MPIFDLRCKDCEHVFEYFFVRSDDFPTCPKCGGQYFEKLISCPHIRMDSDQILKSLPDPSPPLEELRGKGSEGYKDKPYADPQLKNYVRKKDKYGNSNWEEKRRQYFHG